MLFPLWGFETGGLYLKTEPNKMLKFKTYKKYRISIKQKNFEQSATSKYFIWDKINSTWFQKYLVITTKENFRVWVQKLSKVYKIKNVQEVRQILNQRVWKYHSGAVL